MLSIIIASTQHFGWNRCRSWWWIVAWSWILGPLEPKNLGFSPMNQLVHNHCQRSVDPWAWCWSKSIFMTSIKLSLIHWLDSCILKNRWLPRTVDGAPGISGQTYSWQCTKLILVFPLYFGQMEMLPMMGDYTVTTVNDHMVILCQHYMGTYLTLLNHIA